jgi:hypothetical protein
VDACVRLVDQLEDRAAGYLTLEDVERALGRSLQPEIDAAVLLLDYRTRGDASSVTLCRLNRRHPLVQRLVNW